MALCITMPIKDKSIRGALQLVFPAETQCVLCQLFTLPSPILFKETSQSISSAVLDDELVSQVSTAAVRLFEEIKFLRVSAICECVVWRMVHEIGG
jgi:hypothetical protein